MPASKNAVGPIALFTSAAQPELSPTAYVVAVVVECPGIFEPVSMRETWSQGAGNGTREEAQS